jgi:N-acyl-D-aspartate/D-glutamate deacylase
MTHDLVIRNGIVVDGTGAPSRAADVAVDGGVITAIGPITDRGTDEIDATGCLVTPGFVDPHTHLDAQLCWDPTAAPSCHHGVTTVLIGMCGFGIAPHGAGDGDYLLRSLEMVEEIPYESTSLGVDFAWSTWPEFLTSLEARRPIVNVGGMVPHSALRYYVMGERARGAVATADERAELRAELRRSLDGGALGFATSRGPNHLDAFGDPVPSRHADDDELRELVMECRGRPWQINIRSKVSAEAAPMIEEVDRYAGWTREAGARLTWSPFVAEPDETVWRAVLDHHRQLNRRTVVRPQVSVLAAAVALRFEGQPSVPIHGWEGALDGFFGLAAAERLSRLGDVGFRGALRGSLGRSARPRMGFGATPCLDEWVLLHTATRPDVIGMTVEEVAEADRTDPVDTLCDLLIADGLATRFQAPVANTDADAVAALCTDDNTLVGLGDAGAHVESITNFSYPTELLARGVRDSGRYRVEQAVRAMTAEPAQFFGLADRGELRPGFAADACVIDLARLAAGRTTVAHDLPGGAARLMRDATGYVAVVVNGVQTIAHDELTGQASGRAIRR